MKYGTKLLIPRREVEPADTSETAESAAGMTLAEWAALVRSRAVREGGSPGPSASDLLLEERYERGYGAGS